jgi:hypothetical protein
MRRRDGNEFHATERVLEASWIAGSLGSAAMMAGLPENAMAFGGGAARIVEDAVVPAQTPGESEAAPKYHIKFAVCGMSHDHIYGMIGAVQRGGGELVAAWGGEEDKLAAFRKRYPDVKIVATQDEILDDPACSWFSPRNCQRARPACRARNEARQGFSLRQAGLTTLEQLAEVRKTIAETKRIYAIMYSELLEVKAAVYAGTGAPGRDRQGDPDHQYCSAPDFSMRGTRAEAADGPTGSGIPINMAESCATSARTRWISSFSTPAAREAEVVESQIANVRHPEHPRFQDFGDMVLRGNKGFGYVRLDWFTPDGLGTWGDGRLFILGTDGYMEVRKYTNVGVSHQGNNLFVVDSKQARYIDCNAMPLPFGPQFVADIVNRTHIAQNQDEALLAAELVIKAQLNARFVTIES